MKINDQILASWQNQEKSNDQIPRKHSDRCQEGRMDRHRIIPATTRRLTSATAVDWHVKVKNNKCNVGLIKNYCITVSMQKISSIHKLIHQILGSHELHTMPISDQAHPKIIEITFCFPQFAPSCKESVHSINSFLRYSQF